MGISRDLVVGPHDGIKIPEFICCYSTQVHMHIHTSLRRICMLWNEQIEAVVHAMFYKTS